MKMFCEICEYDVEVELIVTTNDEGELYICSECKSPVRMPAKGVEKMIEIFESKKELNQESL